MGDQDLSEIDDIQIDDSIDLTIDEALLKSNIKINESNDFSKQMKELRKSTLYLMHQSKDCKFMILSIKI